MKIDTQYLSECFSRDFIAKAVAHKQAQAVPMTKTRVRINTSTIQDIITEGIKCTRC